MAIQSSITGALVASLALFGAAHAAVDVDLTYFPTNPAGSIANVVLDNYMGISWELSSFNTLWGNNTSGTPKAMQNYLSNIAARISNPLRMRVGGDTMEFSNYSSALTKTMLKHLDVKKNYTVATTYGPVLFDVMNKMADDVGEMQFLTGLSMHKAPENGGDAEALKVASVATEKLGSRLDAFLLGNEPDLYQDHKNRKVYNISDYIGEVDYIVNDLTTGPYGDLRSKDSLAGPSICCDWELSDVLNAGLAGENYKYYAVQHYPDIYCFGPTASNTNISNYLTHTSAVSYSGFQSAGIASATAAGIPVIMSEANSCACGGCPLISPTFAATLWEIDAFLALAANNYSAAYIHTREYGVTYNLFDPPASRDPLDSDWKTGATYYSALMMSEVMSKNGSIVVDMDIQDSKSNPDSHIATYGIYDLSTSTGSTSRLGDMSQAQRGKFVFINYDNSTSTTFQVPANVASTIGLRYLLAPKVTEETDITWAGQTVGKEGKLKGSQETKYVDCSGSDGCTIKVPGPGLVLALLNPNTTSSFYQEA